MSRDYHFFQRILGEQVYDWEEIRKDMPLDFANSFEYVGLAHAGSLTSDPVWHIVRKSRDMNTRPIRLQYQSNISWDNRGSGWS